jgi:signal transduction histidine kinase
MTNAPDERPVSSGIAALDALLEELRVGDNVVFLTEHREDYVPFVAAVCAYAASLTEGLVYLRGTGSLDALVSILPDARVIQVPLGLTAEGAREYLTTELASHRSARYVVCDPLDQLCPSASGAEDAVPLFLALCPLLYRMDTIAYWCIQRESLGRQSIAAIKDCTQILLSLERVQSELHLTPIKVWGRYSADMFRAHRVARSQGRVETIAPLPLAVVNAATYAQALAAKNQELATVRDQLHQRNQELNQRNAQLAEANAQTEEQSRLYRSLHRNLDHLVALLKAGQTIGTSLVVDQVQQAILQAAVELFGVAGARMSLAARSNHGPLAIALGRVPPSAAGTPGDETTTEDVAAPPAVSTSAPILARGVRLGQLDLFDDPASQAGPDLRTLLTYFTAEASMALDNAYLYEQLETQGQQLQWLVDNLIATEEQESRRLALDLHDGLVQLIIASYQHLQMAQVWRDKAPDIEEREFHQGLQLLRESIHEARQLIAQLRPAGLDDFGLVQALRLFVTRIESQADWQVKLLVTPAWSSHVAPGALSKSMASALFRIVQEATNNARKYAGSRRLEIRLDVQDAELELQIRDWGQGFDPANIAAVDDQSQRMGLVGIRERARLLGGRCSITSRPGAGTIVALNLPLERALGPVETNAASNMGEKSDPRSSSG